MITCHRRDVLRLLGASAASGAALSRAQGVLQLIPLAPRLSLLTGAGGNITIFESGDGLLMTDSGLPDTVAALLAKLKQTSAAPVRHVINTHWHYDHVGANEQLAKSGAVILAHVNTARRLGTAQKIAYFSRDVPALPAEGRPKETFVDQGKLSFGGQDIRYQCLPPAHTDGDTTVHFTAGDVFVGGDLLFNGMYPFIDHSSGGSLEGMARNAAAIARAIGPRTKVVPGHGPVMDRSGVEEFAGLLADADHRISLLMKAGKSLDEMIAADPLKKYDAKWGQGFMKSADWIKLIHYGKSVPRQ